MLRLDPHQDDDALDNAVVLEYVGEELAKENITPTDGCNLVYREDDD